MLGNSKMNVNISDIWGKIQTMANNFHNSDCVDCDSYEWNTNITSVEELRSQFMDITSAIIDANANARLIKRIDCMCMLLDFTGLCFRVGFYRSIDGSFMMFVDFQVNPVDYAEFHL